MNDVAWLILMLPVWAVIIGIIDNLLFRHALDSCPVCKTKGFKVRWWWFIIPTMLELLMFVAGYAIGAN